MVFFQEQWERDRLADALDDTPETVIPVHFLRRGLADAWVAGTAPRFDGVIVQAHLLQQEPWCFGRDPSAIWGLLRPLIDWGRQSISPNVPADMACQLATLHTEQDADVRCRQYGDVYHTLRSGELTNSPFQRSGRWTLKMRASWPHIGATRVRWASQLSKTF